MTDPTAADLYDRQLATLLASWEANARGSDGAAVLRLSSVTAAVFPAEPERGIFNNAVLARGLKKNEHAAAVTAMEAVYADAGVESFAAWVHESDEDTGIELSERGYEIIEQTRAMTMALKDTEPSAGDPPGVEISVADWADYLKFLHGLGLPRELLAGVDPAAYRVVAAHIDGQAVATGLAFDHDDCGIFNLSTLEPVRRRGIATALTSRFIEYAKSPGDRR